MHGKYGWHDIQLFGDIITDVDQVTATLPTLAGGWFMAEFDARQMPGQGLAAGTLAFWFFVRTRGLMG
jgi:hypothetical protein